MRDIQAREHSAVSENYLLATAHTLTQDTTNLQQIAVRSALYGCAWHARRPQVSVEHACNRAHNPTLKHCLQSRLWEEAGRRQHGHGSRSSRLRERTLCRTGFGCRRRSTLHLGLHTSCAAGQIQSMSAERERSSEHACAATHLDAPAYEASPCPCRRPRPAHSQRQQQLAALFQTYPGSATSRSACF